MTILNEHYTETDFRMVIFGPAISPAVFIGDQLYQVNMKIEAGEYVTIDSSQGTIILTKTDGSRENAFNSREKRTEYLCQNSTGHEPGKMERGFWI